MSSTENPHGGLDLRARVAGLMPRARTELAELVALPSVADPRQFPPRECEYAANWVCEAFAGLGFTDARLVLTSDGSRAVVGSRPCPDPGAPTVLLYTHYDVQPPLDETAWHTPPFALTEVGGRWYGRGSADCKGNIVATLTALRALGEHVPVHLKLAVEGSEEQGTGGLADLIRQEPDLFRADAVLVCDTGNAEVGKPSLTVSLRGMVNVVVAVETLATEVHSGMYGGAAPDALAALVAVLATLRDGAGNTTVRGLAHDQVWPGEPYPAERFRADSGVLPGVELVGEGPVADQLWARPAVTVLGIDCPPVLGSAAAITPRAAARINLRFPPGIEPAQAGAALADHLRAAAPWGAHVTVQTQAGGAAFHAATGGPAYLAVREALREAYRAPVTTLGQGGSIPLCTVLAETFPDAEIILLGVEEPKSLIHAPNESVAPGEIAGIALALALFLQRYGQAG
ncbi:acetylornithine deacetylase/succinyl-diaminopimelate desuccinylase-like protein [Crossiella equi]|uniref:Acetylornithine deacetylase/succinyl-diaminopimelate desuccinylase-like protein n=1 Tax=Crossiella equi TaxID=130796 RepID=A0ABS5A610_9PSEU|nr:dipeptidase [Crossiella equi]MBP2472039.1 acetylornithine deacetylase/succinyl-diaminopimelate desuccinylase-like protein [Crossiella equi]